MKREVLALDPERYRRHPIHGDNRIWAETNCYVDVWVELLHAWGLCPVAALPFTLAIDFEGDQWTFFKFPLADLDRLHGLDVQELAIWRPLVTHVEEQVGRGRPVLVELDSFHLPDTAGTAYRREHVKSTVAVVAIDLAERRLGYFHNQGYYHLEGTDFLDVFRLHEPKDLSLLPPYVEFVKRRGPALSGEELVLASLELLRGHLRRLPEANPFVTFKERFEADLDWLAREGLDTFHLYSFATLRQFGACYELATTYLQWLQERARKPLEGPIADLLELATRAKTLQFHLARAMARKKALDLSALDDAAGRWRSAMGALQEMFL
jgi:Domain of unknown function (DUF1839)